MPNLTDQIRVALYTKLNVSGVTNLATGGVWSGEAGETTALPYVVFEEISAVPFYTFGNTEIAQDSLISVKVFTETGSADSAIGLGQQVIDQARDAIGESLNLSSGSTWAVYWDRDLPTIRQPISDRHVYMQGFLLRVVAEEIPVSYLTFNGDYLTFNGDRLRFTV